MAGTLSSPVRFVPVPDPSEASVPRSKTSTQSCYCQTECGGHESLLEPTIRVHLGTEPSFFESAPSLLLPPLMASAPLACCARLSQLSCYSTLVYMFSLTVLSHCVCIAFPHRERAQRAGAGAALTARSDVLKIGIGEGLSGRQRECTYLHA